MNRFRAYIGNTDELQRKLLTGRLYVKARQIFRKRTQMLIKKLEPDLARDFKPFDEWWQSKEIGPVVWYDGYLPLDRAMRKTKTAEENAEASYVNDFAKMVWSLYNDGLVTLTQSKMHIFRYLYFIERKH